MFTVFTSFSVYHSILRVAWQFSMRAFSLYLSLTLSLLASADAIGCQPSVAHRQRKLNHFSSLPLDDAGSSRVVRRSNPDDEQGTSNTHQHGHNRFHSSLPSTSQSSGLGGASSDSISEADAEEHFTLMQRHRQRLARGFAWLNMPAPDTPSASPRLGRTSRTSHSDTNDEEPEELPGQAIQQHGVRPRGLVRFLRQQLRHINFRRLRYYGLYLTTSWVQSLLNPLSRVAQIRVHHWAAAEQQRFVAVRNRLAVLREHDPQQAHSIERLAATIAHHSGRNVREVLLRLLRTARPHAAMPRPTPSLHRERRAGEHHPGEGVEERRLRNVPSVPQTRDHARRRNSSQGAASSRPDSDGDDGDPLRRLRRRALDEPDSSQLRRTQSNGSVPRLGRGTHTEDRADLEEARSAERTLNPDEEQRREERWGSAENRRPGVYLPPSHASLEPIRRSAAVQHLPAFDDGHHPPVSERSIHSLTYSDHGSIGPSISEVEPLRPDAHRRQLAAMGVEMHPVRVRHASRHESVHRHALDATHDDARSPRLVEHSSSRERIGAAEPRRHPRLRDFAVRFADAPHRHSEDGRHPHREHVRDYHSPSPPQSVYHYTEGRLLPEPPVRVHSPSPHSISSPASLGSSGRRINYGWFAPVHRHSPPLHPISPPPRLHSPTHRSRSLVYRSLSPVHHLDDPYQQYPSDHTLSSHSGSPNSHPGSPHWHTPSDPAHWHRRSAVAHEHRRSVVADWRRHLDAAHRHTPPAGPPRRRRFLRAVHRQLQRIDVRALRAHGLLLAVDIAANLGPRLAEAALQVGRNLASRRLARAVRARLNALRSRNENQADAVEDLARAIARPTGQEVQEVLPELLRPAPVPRQAPRRPRLPGTLLRRLGSGRGRGDASGDVAGGGPRRDENARLQRRGLALDETMDTNAQSSSPSSVLETRSVTHPQNREAATSEDMAIMLRNRRRDGRLPQERGSTLQAVRRALGRATRPAIIGGLALSGLAGGGFMLGYGPGHCAVQTQKLRWALARHGLSHSVSPSTFEQLRKQGSSDEIHHMAVLAELHAQQTGRSAQEVLSEMLRTYPHFQLGTPESDEAIIQVKQRETQRRSGQNDSPLVFRPKTEPPQDPGPSLQRRSALVETERPQRSLSRSSSQSSASSFQPAASDLDGTVSGDARHRRRPEPAAAPATSGETGLVGAIRRALRRIDRRELHHAGLGIVFGVGLAASAIPLGHAIVATIRHVRGVLQGHDMRTALRQHHLNELAYIERRLQAIHRRDPASADEVERVARLLAEAAGRTEQEALLQILVRWPQPSNAVFSARPGDVERYEAFVERQRRKHGVHVGVPTAESEDKAHAQAPGLPQAPQRLQLGR